MRTRMIGSLEVSAVGLGCNNFGSRLDAERTASVVHAALDAGISLFDTADIYGGTHSEEFLGKALSAQRDNIVLATKFGIPLGEGQPGGAGAGYVRQALEASLRRLNTDHIDLYQLHFPDRDTPISETLEALSEEVHKGKVREIGCSNFSVEQLEDASTSAPKGGSRFVSVQNQYNILQRDPEKGVLDACTRLNMAFIPYSPLANGLLTGKYAEGEEPPEGTRLASLPAERSQALLGEENMAVVSELTRLAKGMGRSMTEVAVAWLLSRPQVASVIAGATQPEQVKNNVGGADWELSADDVAAIDRLSPDQAA